MNSRRRRLVVSRLRPVRDYAGLRAALKTLPTRRRKGGA